MSDADVILKAEAIRPSKFRDTIDSKVHTVSGVGCRILTSFGSYATINSSM